MNLESQIRLLASASLAMLIASCAVTRESEIFDAQGRAWPESPEIERIVFVREFSNAEDLSIGESFWESIVSIFAGKGDFAQARPMAVAATTDGKVIFVADPDVGCVHRYDLRRHRYTCLASAKSEPRVSAVGLAVTEDDVLFVTDSTNGQIWKASAQMDEVVPFWVSRTLKQPTGIYWSANTQSLLVTDTAAQVVLEFDRMGNLRRKIGERGNLPGQFNFPTYLWVNNENELLVTDSLNFRLQRLSRDGDFLGEFGENGDRPGDFSRPKGVATDSLGHIYVVDALMHAVQILNKQGELLLSIGNHGSGEGEFWLPNGIFITPENLIFVADSYNKRVQVFRYVGPES